MAIPLTPQNPQSGLISRLRGSVTDYNNQFIQNNPQYGRNPFGPQNGVTNQLDNSHMNVSAPKPGQGAYLPNGATIQPNGGGTAMTSGNAQPIGLKATTPTSKVTPPANTLPSGQVAKPTPQPQGGSTNGATTPSSPSTPTNPYTAAVGGLYNYGNVANDPQYQKMLGEYNNIAQSQPVALTNIMNDTTRGIPNTVEQSRIGATNDQYSQQLSAKTAQLNQYLGAKGQAIGALGNVTSATQPVQVSPGNFYVSPFTGQDVTGGSVNPFSGGIRQAQVGLGGQYANNDAILGGARGIANQFLGAVAQNPDFNSGSLNFGNAINQLVQNNYSNPAYPGIQSSFNNLISQYSSILGGKDAVLNIIRTANPQSMQSLISSLDAQANAIQGGIRSAGTGGGPGTQLNNNPLSVAQPQQPVSGRTSSGLGYTVITN